MALDDSLFDRIQVYGSRISTNLSLTASRYTLQDYVRLVVIMGAYCLLRPYLIKLGAKFQAKDHEREVDLDKGSSPAAVKSSAAHAMRGVREQVPEDTDSEQDDGTGADWGKGARRRQRLMIKRLLEQAEKEKDDDEEDRDIQDLLED